MKQWLAIINLTVILVIPGCGTSKTQIAAGIVYDAKAQISAARAADAQSLATHELTDAEQFFARAQEALNNGKEDEAYRLAVRAYLKGQVAEAIAVANRMEENARAVEQELVLKRQAVEAARRDLEQAERELADLQSTLDE